MPNANDPAAARFWIISAMRLVGAGLVVAGLLIVSGAIESIAPDIRPILGGALLIIGILDLFVVPLVLARKWRTPR